MSHTTLRQAALGVIAILAVVLMLKVSGSAGDRAGSTRRVQDRELSPDDGSKMAASL